MKKNIDKTNVMRLLEQKKIAYIPHFYDTVEAVSGTVVAEMIGVDPSRVFKTLVTVGASKQNYVIPMPYTHLKTGFIFRAVHNKIE